MQTYTQAERTAIDEVHRHQLLFSAPSPSSSPIPQPTELHIALDGAGTNEIARQIHPARGGNMTATMQAAANSAGGCRMIHNHPSEHSLSSADWNVLAHHSLMEMTAVNSFGTTFRGKVLDPAAFPCWQQAITAAETNVSNLLNTQGGIWVGQGDWALVDQASETWAIGWAIGDRLRNKGYVEFECVPGGKQIGAVSSQYRQALDQAVATAIP